MTVVARWEWRVFGDSHAVAHRRLTAADPDRVEDSEEVYLIGRSAAASVKVRGGRLDAKRLLGVDRDGLEQWVPTMKADFPLTLDELAPVFALLGAPEPAEPADSLDALLTLVAADPQLCAVPVRKHREHYTFAGCMAEASALRTAAGTIRTLAVESPDRERVAAAVSALGLAGRPVVSVPRALKALVGFGDPRAAVIDVGTNSVKFHVGERADGRWRTVVARAEITRLGEGLSESGRLSPEAIERTVEAIAAMMTEARTAGAGRVAAVGTAGLRIATNAGHFIDAVRDRCGLVVEVLPAEEETRLAYVAAVAGLDLTTADPIAVFDTGGGSTQFTFTRGGQLGDRFSVDIGAVRLTERFGLDGPLSPDGLQAALRAIEAELAVLRGRGRPGLVVGMGGAVTNLAAVRLGLRTYDPDAVQGLVLGRDEIERQIELYRCRSAAERREITGLQPARAEVILAGACVVRSVLVLLDADSLTVSDRGLRHGVLEERFGRFAVSRAVDTSHPARVPER